MLQSLLLCVLFLTSSSTAQTPRTSEARKQPTPSPEGVKGVIELTSVNLDQHIRDGSIWFIEFYAPWCHHCNAFADAYATMAHTIHALNDADPTEPPPKTVDTATSAIQPSRKVAKINADKERACMSRFNVHGFPAFYLIDGWTVYQYTGKRNEQQMIAYIRGGYKSEDSIPMWSSPMGPMGQLQALVFYLGNSFFSLYHYLVETQELPPAMAAFTFAFGGIAVCIVTMITVAIILSGKVKED